MKKLIVVIATILVCILSITTYKACLKYRVIEKLKINP